jgi:soluble epoxide hydrolase / lipid-phosphate phosphatase
VNVPTLLIVAEKDCVCLPEIQKQGSAPWVKQLRVETFPCGHWVQLEMPEKLNELLVEFATGL